MAASVTALAQGQARGEKQRLWSGGWVPWGRALVPWAWREGSHSPTAARRPGGVCSRRPSEGKGQQQGAGRNPVIGFRCNEFISFSAWQNYLGS